MAFTNGAAFEVERFRVVPLRWGHVVQYSRAAFRPSMMKGAFRAQWSFKKTVRPLDRLPFVVVQGPPNDFVGLLVPPFGGIRSLRRERMFGPGLDEGPLGELVALAEQAPKLPQRGAEVLQRARDAKRFKRLQAQVDEAKAELECKVGVIDTLQVMFPKVAAMVGAKPKKQHGPLTHLAACGIIHTCFSSSASAAAAKRTTGILRCEYSLTKGMQSLCRDRIFNDDGNGLLHLLRQMRSSGAVVVIGWFHEWDETKQWLKSLLPPSAQKDNNERLAQLVKSTRLQFQQQTSSDIMVQGGRLIVKVLDVNGKELVNLDEPWICAPTCMAGKKAPLIQAALQPQMLFNIFDDKVCGDLNDAADVIVGVACSDKASSNISVMASLRARTESLPSSFLFHEHYCELHNLNNLKAGNQDYKELVTKLFGLANLMRSSDYVAKSIARIQAAVQERLRFWPTGVADPECQTRNKMVLDGIFHLNNARHDRKGKDGKVTGKSQLWCDLQELLALETGDFSDATIEHVCTVDDAGRRCCKNRAHCVDRFVEIYVRLYFGRRWPIPATSRFTYVRTNMAMVMFGYAHHMLLVDLIGQPKAQVEELLGAENLGAQMSDFQLVHGLRQARVSEYFVQDPLTKARVAILSTVCEPVDDLIHKLFGGEEGPAKVHDLVAEEESLLVRAQDRLVQLLDEWHMEDSATWRLMDSACPARASEAEEQVRHMARRQVLIFAGALHRRVELPFANSPWDLHKLACDKCGGNEEARRIAQERLLNSRPCDLSFFAERFRTRFPNAESLNSAGAEATLAVWEKLQMFTTKSSERQHASGKRVLGSNRKAWSLAAFSCRCFLEAHRERHHRVGGYNLSAPLPDAKAISDTTPPADFRPGVPQKPLMLKDVFVAASGAPAELLPLLDDQAEDDGDTGEHNDLECQVVPVLADNAAEDEAEPVQKKRRHGLNPLLVAINARMKAAKALKKAPLTEEEMCKIRSSAHGSSHRPLVSPQPSGLSHMAMRQTDRGSKRNGCSALLTPHLGLCVRFRGVDWHDATSIPHNGVCISNSPGSVGSRHGGGRSLVPGAGTGSKS